MQLLRIDWNVIFTIVNLIVLYLGLRKFLIGPVTKVMDQRKQLIEGQMADARHVNEQANELKAQYEDALKQAHEESAQILSLIHIFRTAIRHLPLRWRSLILTGHRLPTRL